MTDTDISIENGLKRVFVSLGVPEDKVMVARVGNTLYRVQVPQEYSLATARIKRGVYNQFFDIDSVSSRSTVLTEMRTRDAPLYKELVRQAKEYLVTVIPSGRGVWGVGVRVGSEMSALVDALVSITEKYEKRAERDPEYEELFDRLESYSDQLDEETGAMQ